MHFTEVFIRRPVLSLVVSALILLAGLRAQLLLPVEQYPTTVSATIQIVTDYYGADAATVAGFITTPIENAVAATNGLDYVISQSQTGVSTVTLHMKLNQDLDRAMTEVQTYVAGAEGLLPAGFQQPLITLGDSSLPALQISVTSHVLSPEQLSDYAARVLQPQLQAVAGVQQVQNQAGIKLALRVWCDARKLGGYGMTATDAVARCRMMTSSPASARRSAA